MSMQKQTVLIFLLAFLIAFPLAADNDRDSSGPALWSLGDEDTTVYLFGTIHLMKQEVDWFTGDIRKAFEQADTLILEIDQTEIDPEKQRDLLRRLALLPQGETLADKLSGEHMEQLVSLFEPAGISKKALQQWRPWYVSLMVVTVAAQKAGFKPQYGVESTLLNHATQAGKQIEGLETLREQLELFAHLEEGEAVYFLEDALQEQDMMGELFGKLKDSWLEQDFAALENLLLESKQENPSFYQDVYVKRNNRWVSDIEQLLEEQSTYFVAVGSAHLVGEESLITLLRERGYEVERR